MKKKYKSLFDDIDLHYAKIGLYASATVVLTLAVVMVLYSASPVIWTIWDLLTKVLEPLVYGAALCYVFHPLVAWVSRQLEKRKRYAGEENAEARHSMAIIFSLIMVVLFVLIILAMMAIMLTHSLSGLSVQAMSDLWADAQGDLTLLLQEFSQMLEDWGIASTDPNSGLLGFFNGAKNFATTALFSVIFCVYLLFDGKRVVGYLKRVLSALLHGRAIDISHLLEDADFVFSGYFRGQGIDALIMGICSAVVLTAVGVPYAPMIGLLTGLGNLIPYVGGPVGFSSIVLMCLPDAAWSKMIIGLIAMAVVMSVDGNIINPRLLSNNVEVHPILVLGALIAGGAIGGIAGMLVAVPTAAFLKIQLDRWLERREKSLAEEAEAEEGEESDQDEE